MPCGANYDEVRVAFHTQEYQEEGNDGSACLIKKSQKREYDLGWTALFLYTECDGTLFRTL